MTALIAPPKLKLRVSSPHRGSRLLMTGCSHGTDRFARGRRIEDAGDEEDMPATVSVQRPCLGSMWDADLRNASSSRL